MHGLSDCADHEPREVRGRAERGCLTAHRAPPGGICTAFVKVMMGGCESSQTIQVTATMRPTSLLWRLNESLDEKTAWHGSWCLARELRTIAPLCPAS